MSQEMTTTNLSDFGVRERLLLIELLTAWNKQGLPKDFYTQDVIVMTNRDSGRVFLTNSEFQCVLMNGDTLEMWHTCGSCGHDGFQEDCQLNDDGCNECNPINCRTGSKPLN